MERHPPGASRHYFRAGRTDQRPQRPAFNTLQRRCLKLGDFASGNVLETRIMSFIATYNRLDAHPYRWTYTGDVLAA